MSAVVFCLLSSLISVTVWAAPGSRLGNPNATTTTTAVPSVAALPKGQLLSRTIGSVGDDILTSRQAALAGLIEVLSVKGAKVPKAPAEPESEAAARERSALLLEEAVSREAVAFGIGGSENSEAASLIERTQKHLSSESAWRKFDFSTEEVRTAVQRKLTAKALIRIKSQSMTSSIPDTEAQAYFEKNRVKFGTLPFASFKDNIKTFLAQQQLEDRLRSWFEILRRKYRVKEDRGDRTRS